MKPRTFKILKIIIVFVGVTALIDVATTIYSGGEFKDSVSNLIFGIGMICFWFIKPKNET